MKPFSLDPPNTLSTGALSFWEEGVYCSSIVLFGSDVVNTSESSGIRKKKLV